MTIDQYRTFVTLASVGSITKTAQKMMVVPSTVSKQIKQIEDEIGHELIIRDKKTIKLTRPGELFFEHARKMLELEENFIDSISNELNEENCIKIGSVQSLFQIYVTAWINKYYRINPKAKFSVYTNHSDIMLNKLYDGKLDICFSYRSSKSNSFVCKPFVKSEMIFVTGGDNEKYPEGISIEEIRKLPLVMESQLGVISKKLHKEIFHKNDNVIMSINIGNYIVPFLEVGNGYGFVNKNFVLDKLERGSLTEIRIHDVDPLYIQSYMVYKPNRNFDAIIENLGGFCEKYN